MASAGTKAPSTGDMGHITPGSEVGRAPTIRPGLWFAAFGAGCVGFQLYLHTRWVLSRDFRPIPTGVTPVSTAMKIAVRTTESAAVMSILLTLYFVVWRPYRREGRLTLNGTLVLAGYFMYWQDPLFDYLGHFFNYSSYTINVGSWARYIPGWTSPNPQNIPQPLWGLCFYFVIAPGGAILGSKVLHRWQERNPRMSTGRMFAAAVPVLAAATVALEVVWLHIGMYHYGGAPHGNWTILRGRFFQLPLSQCLINPFFMLCFISVRYFVNDRGECLADRGTHGLGLSPRQLSMVRFLGCVGAMNLAFMLGYSIPVQLVAVHAGQWPREIQERSYFTTGLCGAGTTYACGGAQLPIPRPGRTLHVDPDGHLVVPRGADITDLHLVPFRTR